MTFSRPFDCATKTLTALTLAVALGSALPSFADTFSVQYFKVPSGTPDFYPTAGVVPAGTSNDYVLPDLGPDGLPVFNPSFTTANGTVDAPAAINLNSANEILWWTPTATNNVIADGTGTKNITSTPVNMFPPAGSGTSDFPDEEPPFLPALFRSPAPAMSPSRSAPMTMASSTWMASLLSLWEAFTPTRSLPPTP